MSTTTPSAVNLASTSTQRAPRRFASRMPSRVFSGAWAAAPRCPTTAGSANAGTTRPVALAGSLGPPGQVFAGGLVDRLHAELDLAAIVHADDLHLDGIADLDDVAHGLHPVRRQLADVDEAVAAAEEVHEGAEVDDLHDLAGVDNADLRLGDDAADP